MYVDPRENTEVLIHAVFNSLSWLTNIPKGVTIALCNQGAGRNYA
jgi:hypothetical protein